MCPDVPYFIILLRLMPDDFTHQLGRVLPLKDLKTMSSP
jgi:hypothetical protein